ncbi:MAG: DUF6285 domain-containing protein [Pseudomonadota bacterium]
MTSREVLLQALNDFLTKDVQPQLSGASAYKTRIARNLINLLLREVSLGDSLAALDAIGAETFALEGDFSESLSVALRDGQVLEDEALITFLRRRTLLQMAIDNPRYSGFREACARWPDLVGKLGEELGEELGE